MYEEKKRVQRENKQKQNFHLNVNKRPMKKKIKSSQASKREQNRFCKKRLLSQKKIQKTKTKQGLFYFNKYQP